MPTYQPKPTRSAVLVDPDEGTSVTADQIILPEDDCFDTGLLDAQGNRLYRVREPVGYRAR